MEKPNIKTIAFEGLHRSGKGTQIEILNHKLEILGIPTISIRGAGSRPNLDSSVGDPYSLWWENHLKVLRSSDAKKVDWVEGSRRLARELVVFRDRVLPKFAKEKNSDVAVLLVDRSVLSHLAILEKDEIIGMGKNIYGTKDIRNRSLPTIEEIFPDIIFYMKADIEVLLGRLEKDDPKYEFRKRNILENVDSFQKAIEAIPEKYRDRIIEINASQSIEEISDYIFNIIKNLVK